MPYIVTSIPIPAAAVSSGERGLASSRVGGQGFHWQCATPLSLCLLLTMSENSIENTKP